MKILIIGFSKAKNSWAIGSRIIQKSENRNFSHIYIRYIDELTKEMIVAQASHGFVNEVNFNIFLESNIIAEEYALTCVESQYIDAISFIKRNLGKPYSYTQLLFIGIKKIFGIRIKVTNNDDEFICSEFGYRIGEILSLFSRNVGENIDFKTPKDIQNLLKQHNI